MRKLRQSAEFRKGSLSDLTRLTFEAGLSVSAESLEFNVLGVGHEFWIALEHEKIIAIAVLSQESPSKLRVLHLEVAPSRAKQGVGTGLVKAVMDANRERELSVIPSGETEEFYAHLGFVHSGRWEMKWSAERPVRL